VLIIGSIGPLKIKEVWMLRRICLSAGIVSTLMFRIRLGMLDLVSCHHRCQGWELIRRGLPAAR